MELIVQKELDECIISRHCCLHFKPLRNLHPLIRLHDSLLFLDLSLNDIVNIKPLSHLPPSLLLLDLSNNRIEDISALRNLPISLKKLKLQNNHIRDIGPLTTLPHQLEILALNYNCITNINPLCDLPHTLLHLVLHHNYINNINALWNLPVSLRVLDIGYNHPLHDFTPLTDQLFSLPFLNVISDRRSHFIATLDHPIRRVRAVLLAFQSRTIHRISTVSALRNISESGFPLGHLLSEFLI